MTFKEADPSSKFEISMGPKARCSGTRNWQLWLLSPMFFLGIYRDIQPTNIGFIHSWTPQQSPQLESKVLAGAIVGESCLHLSSSDRKKSGSELLERLAKVATVVHSTHLLKTKIFQKLRFNMILQSKETFCVTV